MPMVERAPMKTGLKMSQMTDGTPELLRWGWSIVGTGVLAVVLLTTVLGGVSRTGAHTNSGWLALIVALMCLPFGSLLLLLGIAKWARNRALAREKR